MSDDELMEAIHDFKQSAYELGKFSYNSCKVNGVYQEFRCSELVRLQYACPVCGNSMPKGTVDHFYPQIDWPDLSSDTKNWAVICYDCNQSKSSKHPREWWRELPHSKKERFESTYPHLVEDLRKERP